MRDVRTVKTAQLFPLVREMLRSGQTVRIVVTGSSMYPFLRGNIDCVDLRKAEYEKIRRGDIVLALRENGEYVLHRVVKQTPNGFFLIGDHQQWVEGPLAPSQLVAVVSGVLRRDRPVSCDSALWRLLSGLWLGVIPLRAVIFRTYCTLRAFSRFVRLPLGTERAGDFKKRK